MATRKNLFSRSGLPEGLGVLLFILCLILTLAPYAGGLDIGIFKVPDFGPQADKILIWGGPILLVILLLSFILPRSRGVTRYPNPVRLTPIDGAVHVDSDAKYTPNGNFFLEAHFRLMVGERPVTLLGVSGVYYVHGCAAFLLEPKLQIQNERTALKHDLQTLEPPTVLRANSTHNLSYQRTLRPPLQTWCPGDCDHGDLEMVLTVRVDTEEREFSFLFRFTGAREIEEIDRIGPVPRFSDEEVEELKASGELTQPEYELLLKTRASLRYLSTQSETVKRQLDPSTSKLLDGLAGRSRKAPNR